MSENYEEKTYLGECSNCNYVYDKLIRHIHYKDTFYFCDICANTSLSDALLRTSMVGDSTLYRSIAYVGNMILERLEELGKKDD